MFLVVQYTFAMYNLSRKNYDAKQKAKTESSDQTQQLQTGR